MNTFHETQHFQPIQKLLVQEFSSPDYNFRVKGCVEDMSGPIATRIGKRRGDVFLDSQSKIRDIRVQQIRAFQFAHIETKLGFHDA